MSKPRCGLCGKTDNLTKTECCSNWICDDEDNYVIMSFAHNSCTRNHQRSTLCFYHYSECHQGSDWKNCEECRTSFDTEMYVHYGTNEYNFTKLENPPAYEPTRCKNCNKIIKISQDAYIMMGDGKYCCFGKDKSNEKPAQNTQPQASRNIQERRPRSRSEDGLVKGTDPNAMMIENEEVPEAKKRGKSVIKPNVDKKKKKGTKRAWVFIDDDHNKKSGESKMMRGRKKSSAAGRKASSSRANSKTSKTAQAAKSNAASKSKSKPKQQSKVRTSNNDSKYGKRKAKQDDEELERSLSVSKAKSKKVKKNNVDNKSKKNIELIVAEVSTSSRSGRSFSGQRIGNARDTLDLARSTSTGKLKEKKKVQGIKKKT